MHAFQQIQRSQNRHAATLLFTPHLKQQPGIAGSPTPLCQNPENLSPLGFHHHSVPDEDIFLTSANSDSEPDIQSGLKLLNLTVDTDLGSLVSQPHSKQI